MKHRVLFFNSRLWTKTKDPPHIKLLLSTVNSSLRFHSFYPSVSKSSCSSSWFPDTQHTSKTDTNFCLQISLFAYTSVPCYLLWWKNIWSFFIAETSSFLLTLPLLHILLYFIPLSVKQSVYFLFSCFFINERKNYSTKCIYTSDISFSSLCLLTAPHSFHLLFL